MKHYVMGVVVINLLCGILLGFGFSIIPKEDTQKAMLYSNSSVVESVNLNDIPVYKSLGIFTITHYCNCPICCGIWGETTYTGTIPQIEHTISVDPEIIPLGSKVIINGITYTAEDTGSAIKGNRIDIYVGSHEEALQKGVFKVEVFKEEER